MGITKESSLERQRIDYNCNDCIYLERDITAYNHSKTLHHLWQRLHFDLHNKKKLEKAEDWLNKNDWEKALALIEEVNSSKFMFNNDAHIHYGECIKLIKPVSFIPQTSMPENEFCFKHRK